MDNTVCITGNTTRDVELRFLPSGKAVGDVGVAVNKRWLDKATGEQKESTHYFDVTLWDTLAENVAESLPKGTRVVVTGQLELDSWLAEDGTKRSRVRIKADDVAPSMRWAQAVVTRNAKADRAPHPADLVEADGAM